MVEVEDEEHCDRDNNVPEVQLSEADHRPAAPITPPETPTKEKHVDPMVNRVQKKAKSAKQTAASAAEQAAQKVGTTNYSTAWVQLFSSCAAFR